MDRPRWLHLPVFTFRGLQRRERRFRSISGVNRDRHEVYRELSREFIELGEAIEKGDIQEIQCEVADLAILLTEQANADDFSLGRAVNSKLRRNADKYPPRALRRLQRDWRMTPQESMEFAKSRWDRSRDISY